MATPWKKQKEVSRFNYVTLVYESDDYMITVDKYSNKDYILVDANFDLCDLTNERAKSVQALIRKVNTLFV